MTTHKLEIAAARDATAYQILIGSGLLAQAGKWTRKCLGGDAKKLVVVSNQTVFAHYGDDTVRALEAASFSVSHYLLKDGEAHKTMRSAEAVLKFCSEAGLERTDAVVALGGGVVGDIAGFAAAVYLRGIRCLQIPTTLLSMIDSSVGGKTGVNTTFGKNLVGAFHSPSGVLVDTATLKTLPLRELTAGFCEAIKQGALSGKELLEQTNDFLASHPPASGVSNSHDLTYQKGIAALIHAQIAFKASIVAGDERESARRNDARSRKILNFGHTFAHALEKVTGYRYLKHGEAVGYGILFAAELSKSLALLRQNDVKLLNDVVHRAGTLPRLANIEAKEVFEAFKFDKKRLAGSLQMVLLKGIGKPFIATEKDVPPSTVEKVLTKLLQEWA